MRHLWCNINKYFNWLIELSYTEILKGYNLCIYNINTVV